ncbi:hypothetical protein E2320_014296 [Naja naja]|nr:hypothetical protein E2320_014296 [Naja naja]
MRSCYINRLARNSQNPGNSGEPPVGKVTYKVVDDSLEVLTCQAFGFYPKEIQATWTRDGEACKYETLSKNVAPNSDGTYYIQLSIEIDPKVGERFQCYLEHKGLQEPLVLALKEETGQVQRLLQALVLQVTLKTVPLLGVNLNAEQDVIGPI